MEWFPERPGGLDRVYYNCTQYLPKVGVEVKGLVAGSPQVAKDTQGQIKAYAPADVSLFQRWHRVRKSFARLRSQEDFSLIASHFALYTLPVLDLLGDRPLVFHFHGPWALESSVEGSKSLSTWLKKGLEQVTYRRATKFIVLSQAFRDILHQEFQIPCDRISIVPGGVGLEQFNLPCSRSVARTR
jgi:hypothetical protein